MTRQAKPGSAAAVSISLEKMNVPIRVFTWTLDQIAFMLNIELGTLKSRYIYYHGRTTGPLSLELIAARNIAPRDQTPEWRVAENELKRWLKRKGFKFYEASQVTR